MCQNKTKDDKTISNLLLSQDNTHSKVIKGILKYCDPMNEIFFVEVIISFLNVKLCQILKYIKRRPKVLQWLHD